MYLILYISLKFSSVDQFRISEPKQSRIIVSCKFIFAKIMMNHANAIIRIFDIVILSTKVV